MVTKEAKSAFYNICLKIWGAGFGWLGCVETQKEVLVISRFGVEKFVGIGC